MFLSKLTYDSTKPNVRRDLTDCCEMHRSIMAPFPQDGEGRLGLGIQYFEEDGHIIIRSLVPPNPARVPAGYTIAGVKDVTTIYSSITDGQIFRFTLLANPTSRKASGPQAGKRTILPASEWLPWLYNKAENLGFEVDDQISTIPRRICGRKKKGANGPQDPGHYVTLAAVLFQGLLKVTDHIRFRAALENGIGQGKSYGLGMLSLLPAFQSRATVANRPSASMSK